MPKLATSDDVLKARGLSDNLPDSRGFAELLLDLITPIVESNLDTALERYTRTDIFSHRPSVYSNKRIPLSFRLSQGFVDPAQSFALYEIRRHDVPIKYVVPEVSTPVVTSTLGSVTTGEVTVPSHLGTIDESWIITFVSATEFEVEGVNVVGAVAGGPFDIANDLNILNDEISEAYFSIPASAWAGTFEAGDTVTFTTTAADTTIIDPRYYHVDHERGVVLLERWTATGMLTYAATYTAGFNDNGDILEDVPLWLRAACISGVIRYMNAHTSRWNAKKKLDIELQQNEIQRFISGYLNPHVRPRYNMLWPALKQSVFLGVAA